MRHHHIRKMDAARKKLTPGQRCDLVREVYQAVLDDTESFEPHGIGADMAYLFGAIVDKEGRDYVQLAPGGLLDLLQRRFPDPGHAIWLWVFPLEGAAGPAAPPAG